jgi:hypothetical protein
MTPQQSNFQSFQPIQQNVTHLSSEKNIYIPIQHNFDIY